MMCDVEATREVAQARAAAWSSWLELVAAELRPASSMPVHRPSPIPQLSLVVVKTRQHTYAKLIKSKEDHRFQNKRQSVSSL